ncbi:acyl carrier protein [Haloglycomyces albus]|uniref:acyl carrier protein n=1 Tax=Haloglycomyces albus TaxID=526067 RepID=UPI00046D0270|nr:acyl carrier protein [Haloglycomyces albus]
MNETDFREALEEFTDKKADELDMTDDLAEIGADSIALFEFMMKIEDVIGPQGVDVTDEIASVQDLFDCVQDAAERQKA